MNKLIIRVDAPSNGRDVWVAEGIPDKGDPERSSDVRQAHIFNGKDALRLFEQYYDGTSALVRMYELKGDPPKPDWQNPRCFGYAQFYA